MPKWQADEIEVSLEIFKIIYIMKYLIFHGILQRYSAIITLPMCFNQFLR